ncbi:unnamed protein product [Brassica oleracea var. botrytis]|uniref:(rape) hypothetical protein n=1 Tax=Brassica napus TaxID=3708 RepID=A0A816Q3S3_BRANA|nr:unnamed protein product [Brassica napus]
MKSGGKRSSVVEARLLRYWEARNVKRGGDLMWVDMLMVDVNDIEFFCTGKVVRLNVDKGWCYVVCSKCSKKNCNRFYCTVSALECVRCSNANAFVYFLSFSYSVEMAIADDTAECVFLCFDGVMTKLHSK